jgi:hypothetical protein
MQVPRLVGLSVRKVMQGWCRGGAGCLEGINDGGSGTASQGFLLVVHVSS